MMSEDERVDMWRYNREGALLGQVAFALMALIMLLCGLFDGDAIPEHNRTVLYLLALGSLILAGLSTLYLRRLQRKLDDWRNEPVTEEWLRTYFKPKGDRR